MSYFVGLIVISMFISTIDFVLVSSTFNKVIRENNFKLKRITLIEIADNNNVLFLPGINVYFLYSFLRNKQGFIDGVTEKIADISAFANE